MVTIPLGVWLLLTIARHYQEADRALSLGGYAPTQDRPDIMVVIVTSMNRVTVEAVRYAVKRCQEVRAVHVDLDAGCAADVKRGTNAGAARRSRSWNRRTGRSSNRFCGMSRRSKPRGPIG